jgi:hypothetical protein
LSYVRVEEVVDHDRLLLMVVPVATSTIVIADQRNSISTNPHVLGWNAERGYPSTTFVVRASEFGQDVAARITCGGVYLLGL